MYKDQNILKNIHEIGSEFWIESNPERLITERDGTYAMSGRTAIDIILQDILINNYPRKVYMPGWCCDSMLLPFIDRNLEVCFYDMQRKGQIEYFINEDIQPDILYITNYFGYENTIPRESVLKFKNKGVIIIYDRTHSFLLDDIEYLKLADYSFASIRKWTGVIGGATITGLSEKHQQKECPYITIKKDAMLDKYLYLCGDTTVEKDKFLKDFSEFGHHLSIDYRDYEMDNLSYTLFKTTDWDRIKVRRQENAAYLHANLIGVDFLNTLENNSVPLFVPIFFENKEKRDAVRSILIQEKIYCPIHWPKPKYIPIDFAANHLYNTTLSLICDQRYGSKDMERMVNIINKQI